MNMRYKNLIGKMLSSRKRQAAICAFVSILGIVVYRVLVILHTWRHIDYRSFQVSYIAYDSACPNILKFELALPAARSPLKCELKQIEGTLLNQQTSEVLAKFTLDDIRIEKQKLVVVPLGAHMRQLDLQKLVETLLAKEAQLHLSTIASVRLCGVPLYFRRDVATNLGGSESDAFDWSELKDIVRFGTREAGEFSSGRPSKMCVEACVDRKRASEWLHKSCAPLSSTVMNVRVKDHTFFTNLSWMESVSLYCNENEIGVKMEVTRCDEQRNAIVDFCRERRTTVQLTGYRCEGGEVCHFAQHGASGRSNPFSFPLVLPSGGGKAGAGGSMLSGLTVDSRVEGKELCCTLSARKSSSAARAFSLLRFLCGAAEPISFYVDSVPGSLCTVTASVFPFDSKRRKQNEPKSEQKPASLVDAGVKKKIGFFDRPVERVLGAASEPAPKLEDLVSIRLSQIDVSRILQTLQHKQIYVGFFSSRGIFSLFSSLGVFVNADGHIFLVHDAEVHILRECQEQKSKPIAQRDVADPQMRWVHTAANSESEANTLYLVSRMPLAQVCPLDELIQIPIPEKGLSCVFNRAAFDTTFHGSSLWYSLTRNTVVGVLQLNTTLRLNDSSYAKIDKSDFLLFISKNARLFIHAFMDRCVSFAEMKALFDGPKPRTSIDRPTQSIRTRLAYLREPQTSRKETAEDYECLGMAVQESIMIFRADMEKHAAALDERSTSSEISSAAEVSAPAEVAAGMDASSTDSDSDEYFEPQLFEPLSANHQEDGKKGNDKVEIIPPLRIRYRGSFNNLQKHEFVVASPGLLGYDNFRIFLNKFLAAFKFSSVPFFSHSEHTLRFLQVHLVLDDHKGIDGFVKQTEKAGLFEGVGSKTRAGRVAAASLYDDGAFVDAQSCEGVFGDGGSLIKDARRAALDAPDTAGLATLSFHQLEFSLNILDDLIFPNVRSPQICHLGLGNLALLPFCSSDVQFKMLGRADPLSSLVSLLLNHILFSPKKDEDKELSASSRACVVSSLAAKTDNSGTEIDGTVNLVLPDIMMPWPEFIAVDNLDELALALSFQDSESAQSNDCRITFSKKPYTIEEVAASNFSKDDLSLLYNKTLTGRIEAKITPVVARQLQRCDEYKYEDGFEAQEFEQIKAFYADGHGRMVEAYACEDGQDGKHCPCGTLSSQLLYRPHCAGTEVLCDAGTQFEPAFSNTVRAAIYNSKHGTTHLSLLDEYFADTIYDSTDNTIKSRVTSYTIGFSLKVKTPSVGNSAVGVELTTQAGAVKNAVGHKQFWSFIEACIASRPLLDDFTANADIRYATMPENQYFAPRDRCQRAVDRLRKYSMQSLLFGLTLDTLAQSGKQFKLSGRLMNNGLNSYMRNLLPSIWLRLPSSNAPAMLHFKFGFVTDWLASVNIGKGHKLVGADAFSFQIEDTFVASYSPGARKRRSKPYTQLYNSILRNLDCGFMPDGTYLLTSRHDGAPGVACAEAIKGKVASYNPPCKKRRLPVSGAQGGGAENANACTDAHEHFGPWAPSVEQTTPKKISTVPYEIFRYIYYTGHAEDAWDGAPPEDQAHIPAKLKNIFANNGDKRYYFGGLCIPASVLCRLARGVPHAKSQSKQLLALHCGSNSNIRFSIGLSFDLNIEPLFTLADGSSLFQRGDSFKLLMDKTRSWLRLGSSAEANDEGSHIIACIVSLGLIVLGKDKRLSNFLADLKDSVRVTYLGDAIYRKVRNSPSRPMPVPIAVRLSRDLHFFLDIHLPVRFYLCGQTSITLLANVGHHLLLSTTLSTETYMLRPLNNGFTLTLPFRLDPCTGPCTDKSSPPATISTIRQGFAYLLHISSLTTAESGCDYLLKVAANELLKIKKSQEAAHFLSHDYSQDTALRAPYDSSTAPNKFLWLISWVDNFNPVYHFNNNIGRLADYAEFSIEDYYQCRSAAYAANVDSCIVYRDFQGDGDGSDSLPSKVVTDELIEERIALLRNTRLSAAQA
ncbi:hypothetical protein PAPHI01_2450 [Pancytospora philotis]|nr:hypothetical protein PAPHI01_2450 [Pancytospora philotis]